MEPLAGLAGLARRGAAVEGRAQAERHRPDAETGRVGRWPTGKGVRVHSTTLSQPERANQPQRCGFLPGHRPEPSPADRHRLAATTQGPTAASSLAGGGSPRIRDRADVPRPLRREVHVPTHARGTVDATVTVSSRRPAPRATTAAARRRRTREGGRQPELAGCRPRPAGPRFAVPLSGSQSQIPMADAGRETQTRRRRGNHGKLCFAERHGGANRWVAHGLSHTEAVQRGDKTKQKTKKPPPPSRGQCGAPCSVTLNHLSSGTLRKRASWALPATNRVKFPVRL